MNRHNRKRWRRGAAGALIVMTAFVACKETHQASGEVSRNWVPVHQDEYLGVPAAQVQAAIRTRLEADAPAPLTADQWKHVKKLYSTFNQNLLWLTDKGVHQPRVSALLNALANADSDAIKLDAFPLQALAQSLTQVDGNKATATQLADADVLLTSAYAAFGETMLTGQEKPSDFAQAWHINPEEEKVDSALALTLREDDFGAGLVRMRPQDAGYDSLRIEFVNYRKLVTNGGWDSIPSGPSLKPGDRASVTRLAALRQRLRAEGYIDQPSPISASGGAIPTPGARVAASGESGRTGANLYDATLAGAVAEFQARHSIAVDSIMGGETLDALNVPAKYRLAQIATNLERYRWLPRALGSRYILVNVPQFHLIAFDSSKTSLEMKVIVGEEYEEKATPVFSDSMEYVVFRPYWNVTPHIAKTETFPKIAADPTYLARNNMEIWNDNGRKAVRQLPGPKNSLGLVKFLFPNDYNIYLHDTPERALFDKDVRAFSHGCIRVEKPAELAEWVLGWSADKVEADMHGDDDNNRVTLSKKLPVYIVYFTTFVKDGQLDFGNDLYDRDSKLVADLEDVAVPSPQTLQAQQVLRTMANNLD